ncbi:hypothetical protein [Roseiflexus castenholzii]|jgi:hypothetical protein|uniref:hypothetical protein n=1 Tax=Roseiflexus castenholzii TaxID=120962 RepID=UPI003C7BDCE5
MPEKALFMSEHERLSSPDLDLLDVQVWNQYWAELERRVTPLFSRADAAAQALRYLAGLLNCQERWCMY